MDACDARSWARFAGVLLVVSLVAGGFGESYVPGRLMVAGDAAGTARAMAASVGLFRASFVSYLLEACCDLSLTAIFYLLLRPVSRPVSLIAACFGLCSTATFAVGEIFYFTAALPQIDAHFASTLPPDARVPFAYLCLKLYGYVFSVFAAFYGIAVMLRGYLIFRSGYLPRVLGALVELAGGCFIAKNILAVLAPNYDSMLLVLPMLLAIAGMAFWFLLRGVRLDRWEQRVVDGASS